MKNKLQKIGFAMLLACAVNTPSIAQSTNPSPYCAHTLFNMNGTPPSNNSTAGDGINRVQLGTLDHTTGGKVDADSMYVYFSNLPATSITRNQSYTLTVTFSACMNLEPFYYSAWIDFNRNNAFEESERVLSNQLVDNAGLEYGELEVKSRTFTIPAQASLGTSRMCIARASNPQEDFQYVSSYSIPACFDAVALGLQRTFGEVEDYSVEIVSSQVAGISENESTSSVAVYPNPSSDYLQFFVGNNADGVQTGNVGSIFNAQGTKVMEFENPSDNRIDISELKPGYYTIQITNHLIGINAKHRFLIQR